MCHNVEYFLEITIKGAPVSLLWGAELGCYGTAQAFLRHIVWVFKVSSQLARHWNLQPSRPRSNWDLQPSGLAKMGIDIKTKTRDSITDW